MLAFDWAGLIQRVFPPDPYLLCTRALCTFCSATSAKSNDKCVWRAWPLNYYSDGESGVEGDRSVASPNYRMDARPDGLEPALCA